MKMHRTISVYIVIGFLVAIPALLKGESSGTTNGETTIATGFEDSVKTFIYAEDFDSIRQEVSISRMGSQIEFRITQSRSDTGVNGEIRGKANRLFSRRERGCMVPIVKNEPNRRYMGKQKDCLVEIKVNSNWLSFATSNCNSSAPFPSASVKALKLTKTSVETRWVELPRKIVVSPR